MGSALHSVLTRLGVTGRVVWPRPRVIRVAKVFIVVKRHFPTARLILNKDIIIHLHVRANYPYVRTYATRPPFP